MNTLGVSQAPQCSRHNGGTGPTAHQFFMRPTQGQPHGPRIDVAIAGMQPGELRSILLDVSGPISRVQPPDRPSGSFAILDWNPQAAWDQQTQQIICGGRRIMAKPIAYNDKLGRWRQLRMPLDLGRTSGTGHWYGCTATDGAGRVFFGGYVYTPATEQWERFTPNASATGGPPMYEWMPSALGGQGAMVWFGGNRFILYEPISKTWSQQVDGLGHGGHVLVKYHPAHGKLLAVGGSNTEQMASIVDEFGARVQVANCPEIVKMSSGSWIVEHPAGCWLVKTMGPTKRLYAAWPDLSMSSVTWQDLGPAPDAALSYATTALDPARGVVYMVAVQGLYAWKMPELTAP